MAGTAASAGAADQVTIGLIGCGGMGGNHLRMLAARKDVRVTYVCDPDANRLAAAAKTVESAGVKIKGIPGGRVFGYQVEIDPSDRAYTGGVYDEGRRKWLQDLSKNEPARKAFKPNEWNRLKIECKGDSIKTWLNGVPAASVTDNVDPKGFIALQVHGIGKKTDTLEVRWRNIRLKELK